MSAATSILEEGGLGETPSAKCRNMMNQLSRCTDLALPSGPSALRMMKPFISALATSGTSMDERDNALRALGYLAREPSNRDTILEACEMFGAELEGLWLGNETNGAPTGDHAMSPEKLRGSLLILLFRLANYKLQPADLLELDRREGKSDSASTGSEHGGVASASAALCKLLSTKELEPKLYGAASATLSQLALPGTFFNQAAATSVPSKPGGGNGTTSASNNGAELSYVFDGDDVAISSLNSTFSSGVSALIAEVIQGKAFDAVAAAAQGLMRIVEDCDAAAMMARLAEDEEATAEAAGQEPKCWSRAEQRAAAVAEAAQREARRLAVKGLDQVVLSALCLAHNLLLFASQRTAQLRQHLAAESCFLKSTALPFVRLRLDRAARAQMKREARTARENGRSAPDDDDDESEEDEGEIAAEETDMKAAGRAVLLGLRCFAVACFKLKVHRRSVCEDGLVRRLLMPGRLDALYGVDSTAAAAQAASSRGADSEARAAFGSGSLGSGGGPGAALRGECVAAAVKLHVNVEGGFGPTWEAQHAAQTALLYEAVDALAPSGLKSLARCLAGADALPVYRSSRAYATLQPLFDHAAACCPVATLQGATAPTSSKKKKKRNANRNRGRSNGDDNRQPAGSLPNSTIQSQLPAFFPPEAKEAKAARPGGAKLAASAAPTAEGKESSNIGNYGAKNSTASLSNENTVSAPAESKMGGIVDVDRYNNEPSLSHTADAKSVASTTDAKEQQQEEDYFSEDEDDNDDEPPENASSTLASATAVSFATVDFEEASENADQPQESRVGLGWVGSEAFLANRPWQPRTLPPLAGAPAATKGLRA